MVLVMLAVSMLTFGLISLVPGDPALAIVGPNNATPELLAQVREELGLNDPLPIRYANWLNDALHGDFGRSERLNQDVLDTITERLPVTVEIMVLSLFLALLISIPLGIYVAYKAGSNLDKVATTLSFGLLSVPSFIMAISMIILFAVRLHWLPATGWVPLTESVTGNLRTVALPVLTLALTEAAVYTRVLRSDMLGVLQSDFIEFARAKGLGTTHILIRHALRPASMSLLTLIGLQLGASIAGTVVVEQIFALPGLGTMLFAAILTRDLVLIQGGVLLVALAYVAVNSLVDATYTVLDPRISGE